MSDFRMPVTYLYANGDLAWEQEDAWIQPAIGLGVVNEGGERFRIVDVWVNYEAHGGGVGEYGIYAFVEPAQGEDDRLGRLYTYYTS